MGPSFGSHPYIPHTLAEQQIWAKVNTLKAKCRTTTSETQTTTIIDTNKNPRDTKKTKKKRNV